jgi:hypothetical protein
VMGNAIAQVTNNIETPVNNATRHRCMRKRFMEAGLPEIVKMPCDQARPKSESKFRDQLADRRAPP